jgi:predicted nucleic acid-binding protein
MGGLVYDAIHANVARRLNVERLYTFNISNFEHVAPDLQVVAP